MPSTWPYTTSQPLIPPLERILPHSELKRFWQYLATFYGKPLSYRICKNEKIMRRIYSFCPSPPKHFFLILVHVNGGGLVVGGSAGLAKRFGVIVACV